MQYLMYVCCAEAGDKCVRLTTVVDMYFFKDLAKGSRGLGTATLSGNGRIDNRPTRSRKSVHFLFPSRTFQIRLRKEIKRQERERQR